MEYLDIINDNDEVIGLAPIAEIYTKKLLHRIVHIFIVNERGEIALQLRSSTKSFCPLHWSTSVGGHVQSGESFEQAALREYQEELGVTSPLSMLGTDRYDGPGGLSKIFGTFRTVHEGPFFPRKEEVEDVQFFSLDTISYMIVRGEKMNPELVFLLQSYMLT